MSSWQKEFRKLVWTYIQRWGTSRAEIARVAKVSRWALDGLLKDDSREHSVPTLLKVLDSMEMRMIFVPCDAQ